MMEIEEKGEGEEEIGEPIDAISLERKRIKKLKRTNILC